MHPLLYLPRYSGLDCGVGKCLLDCSGHGKCVGVNCECEPGFIGEACEEQMCGSRLSPVYCGNGECINDMCVCHNGYSGPDCNTRE
jgi:hypothetical protein